MDSNPSKAGRGVRDADRNSTRYDIECLRRRVDEDPGAPEYPALAEAERRAGHAAEARRIAEAGLGQAPGRMAGRVSLGLALLDLGEVDAAREALGVILDTALEPHRLEVCDADAEPQTTPKFAAEGRRVFDEEVDDAELARAIREAEPQTDEMHSPNRMAEAVLLADVPADEATTRCDAEGDTTPLVSVQSDALEGEPWHERKPIALDETPSSAVEEPFEVESSPAFATQTMADLLEQQGDHSGARLIRQSLSGAVPDEGEVAGASLAAAEPMDAALVLETNASPEAGGDHGESSQKRILAVLKSWLHNLQRGVP